MRISDWSSDVCSSDLRSSDQGSLRGHDGLSGIGTDDKYKGIGDRGFDMNTARGCDIASARRHHTRLAIDFHCHRTLKNEDLHPVAVLVLLDERAGRSEEHTSELQSLMRISSAVFCLKKKIKNH